MGDWGGGAMTDPCVQYPRGAEVIERLRYGGYMPIITARGIIVKKGSGARDKLMYAQWIDELRDPAVKVQATNYLRLARPKPKGV